MTESAVELIREAAQIVSEFFNPDTNPTIDIASRSSHSDSRDRFGLSLPLSFSPSLVNTQSNFNGHLHPRSEVLSSEVVPRQIFEVTQNELRFLITMEMIFRITPSKLHL